MFIKDKLYDFVVRKNENVRYEYERYVMEHIIEYYENRGKHWKILWKLNWHYRVEKKNEPMMYWDKAKSPIVVENNKVKEKVVKKREEKEELHFPEHENYIRETVDMLVEKALRYDVVSFDIFDTLILRNVSNPKDVFNIIALKLGISNFLQLRVKAEEEARKNSKYGTREVTLREIYEVLHRYCDIDIEKGIETEEDVEMAICMANPYMLEVYNQIRKRGKEIIIISDMYHSVGFIEKLLSKNEITGYKKIYLSNEYRCGKYDDGNLFKIAKKDYHVFTRFIHIGDNYKNDIEMAQKCGIEAFYYKNVNEIGNAYRPNNLIGINSAIYKGIVNSYLHSGSEKISAAQEYGFVFGGLIACGFCQWLNELVKSESIDKILFMARDGFYLKKVYDAYYKEIETEYITISRYAAMQLSFDRYTENYIDFNIRRRAAEQELTIREMLMELELDCLIEKLKTVGLSETEKLTLDNFSVVRAMVYAYKDVVYDSFSQARDAAKQYYMPILNSCKKVCLVDVGWNGTSIVFMKHFIENICQAKVSCIGALVAGNLSRFSANYYDNKVINSYLFSPHHNRDLFEMHNFSIHNLFVEILFSEPKPSFLRFVRREDGEVEEMYAKNYENNNETVENIGIGIIKFAEKYNSITQGLSLELRISARNAYLPLIKAMENSKYMYLLFKNYHNQILPGIADSAERAGDYLERKEFYRREK